MNAIDVIKSALPLVGGLLGGPMGTVAVKLLSDKLTGKPTGTINDIAEKINGMTPDQQIKLKEIESDLVLRTQELYNEQLKMGFDNTANARKREVDLASSGHVDNTCKILGISFTIFYCLLFLVIILTKSDKSIMYDLTLLESIVINYFFGSSLGSANKNQLLQKKGQE